jgi:hypothetical protein
VAPLALADEQVLEVDAVAIGESGVVKEPDRDRDDNKCKVTNGQRIAEDTVDLKGDAATGGYSAASLR